MQIKFKFGEQTIIKLGRYLTDTKIAVEIPKMELPTGINDVVVEVCFNG